MQQILLNDLESVAVEEFWITAFLLPSNFSTVLHQLWTSTNFQNKYISVEKLVVSENCGLRGIWNNWIND